MSFLTSLLNALPGAVAQGLIWGIMAIGVYITYRILDVADLTVDGSLATGGAVCVMLIRAGVSPWPALLCAMLAGMLAGLVTGLFHTKCGIPAILAGILTQLSLYSVNLRIMESKANQAVSVDKYDLLVSQRYVRTFSPVGELLTKNPLPLLLLFTAAVIALLYWFFGTEKGCSIRATGANPNMARAQGIDTSANVVLGSDALQRTGRALRRAARPVSGLERRADGPRRHRHRPCRRHHRRGRVRQASSATSRLQAALPCPSARSSTTSCCRSCSQLGLNTNDLKLVTALIVAVFLAIPYWKGKAFHAQGTEGRRAPCLNSRTSARPSTPAPVNAKVGAQRPEPDARRRRFRHRHRRQRRGQVHHAQRHRGRVSRWTAGSIVIDGQDVTKLPEHKRAALLGRVFQDPMMGTAPTMMIEENLALAARRGQRRGLKLGHHARLSARTTRSCCVPSTSVWRTA